jgi:hypothetical protein
MKAGSEGRGIGPKEAETFWRVSDGDRDSLTCFVGTDCTGKLLPRYYLKEGKVWGEDYLSDGRRPLKDARLLLKSDSYMMDGESLVLILEDLAKELEVTPQHRYALALDGHYSRLEPPVRDAAAKLGFILIVFPGSLTHILQVQTYMFCETHIL